MITISPLLSLGGDTTRVETRCCLESELKQYDWVLAAVCTAGSAFDSYAHSYTFAGDIDDVGSGVNCPLFDFIDVSEATTRDNGVNALFEYLPQRCKV